MYTGDTTHEWESFNKSNALSKKIGTELFSRIGYYLEYSEGVDINKNVEEVLYQLNLQKAVII